ncbi:winged helix-turn-helix domain-containing protein [Aestuariibacter halophilus]|uniref:Winged helix-turn-helix domain-containing protein n=1 Tax=Fluctibacter halophilus TaxID=226011 RepID=A0ABS8G6K7_9ALTE|nr:winged helix-turn-helix domain-containing protein [Aestuariibacter halophilus]MCC2616165.1 winged helix-turn-helix domain-containing protein [Aestuariibacter halophilus]
MIVTFEQYRLDTDNYQLCKNGIPIKVERQVFAVLHTLIENRHKVVTKQDLVDGVWNGRVMSDAAISSRIKSARQAVGDDGKRQRLIKTVHGIGFRFVGHIDAQPTSTQIAAPNMDSAVKLGSDDQRPSIIVLPFALSANSEPSILPQGLAHDLITGLSRLRWLKVISRSSAFLVAQGHTSLNDLCKLTDVRYCLSGFITLTATTMTLHYELTDTQTGAVLYADGTTVGRDDINQSRNELTKTLIGVLELQISDNEAHLAQLKAVENLDAWEAYHLATMHLYRFTPLDNQKATALFKRAVQLEPRFARAHAGLSAAEFQNAFNQYAGVDRQASMNASIDSAQKSIELDRLDPLANFVMGRTYWLKGETDNSIAWLERATTLNPNYAHGYYACGLATLMTRSEQRSYDHSAQAVSLSPIDPFLYGFYGIRAFSYLADEDIENACFWAEKAALQPEAIAVMDLLAAALFEMNKDMASATKWVARARQRHPHIDSGYFFKALPFGAGKIRTLLQSSFSRLSL